MRPSLRQLFCLVVSEGREGKWVSGCGAKERDRERDREREREGERIYRERIEQDELHTLTSNVKTQYRGGHNEENQTEGEDDT